MFLRAKSRTKGGKTHRYWSIVENRRVAGGGVVQRQEGRKGRKERKKRKEEKGHILNIKY
ncbi:MAG: hypothetical protein HRU72_06400 [Planctomycetia bacterium]|nr:MAG: hypothetical protein HRU72_06400 [Planctomycetia bacterium]